MSDRPASAVKAEPNPTPSSSFSSLPSSTSPLSSSSWSGAAAAAIHANGTAVKQDPGHDSAAAAAAAAGGATLVKAEPMKGGGRGGLKREEILEGSKINQLMDLVVKTFFVDCDVVVFEHVNRSGFVLVKDMLHDLLLPELEIRRSLNTLRANKLIESFCTQCQKSSDCDCKENLKNEQKSQAEADRQASVNNAKQQKRAIILKFYYVNELQFFEITKIRVNLLKSAHGQQAVEYRCPHCGQEFTANDIPELRRNNLMHCGTVEVVHVEREEMSSRQEALMVKIARTVEPIEILWRQIDKDTLHDNHPLRAGRKKFIRQWENVAFALQWISVDDLNNKDQNDVIHDLSTMAEEDYTQLFVEMKEAYKPFDLEQAKQDEIEDPTFIPIFLREGSITNQKITPYQKFIRREDRRRRDAALLGGREARPQSDAELAQLCILADKSRKALVKRDRDRARPPHKKLMRTTAATAGTPGRRSAGEGGGGGGGGSGGGGGMKHQ